jgi:hypothetical protein
MKYDGERLKEYSKIIGSEIRIHFILHPSAVIH